MSGQSPPWRRCSASPREIPEGQDGSFSIFVNAPDGELQINAADAGLPGPSVPFSKIVAESGK